MVGVPSRQNEVTVASSRRTRSVSASARTPAAPSAGATDRLNVTGSFTSRSRSCQARLVEDGGRGPARHSRLAQARAKILERRALRRAGQRILEELRHLG